MIERLNPHMAVMVDERASSACKVILLTNDNSNAGMSKTRGNRDPAYSSTYSSDRTRNTIIRGCKSRFTSRKTLLVPMTTTVF